MESGTLSATKNENSNDYYVILNHGVMTINGGTVKSTSTHSSLIDNGYYNFSSSNERLGHVDGVNELYPTLTINNGMFDGGLNTVKNDDNGKLVINNGTFRNTVQVSLMNWNETIVNGGTFETPIGNDKTNVFVGSYGADSNDIGKLIINGGTFNAEHAIEVSKTNPVTIPVEISGGTFNNTKAFINESASFAPVAVDDIEISGNVTVSADAVKHGVEGAKITLTNPQAGQSIEIPEGVEVVIAEDDDFVFVTNLDGTVTVAEVADISKLMEIAEKLEGLKEEDYTEKSLKEFEAIVEPILAEIETLTYTKDEQAKIDEIVLKLEDAMAKLVKKTDVVNPETSDNILTYVGIAASSILLLGAVVVSSKKKLFN